jgi:hypothetical protein
MSDDMLEGTVFETDAALRDSIGIVPEANILRFITVKHQPAPINDPQTLEALQGPPPEPRKSKAGRKPRKRPGIIQTFELREAKKRKVQMESCRFCHRQGTLVEDMERGEITCKECSMVNDGQSSNQNMDFDDRDHMVKVIKPAQCYENSHHFYDIVTYSLGIEPFKINPPSLLDDMREYMKQHLIDPATLTASETYHILKRMGFDKLYKHKVKLTYMLSGKPPPQLTQEQIMTVCNEFLQIMTPLQEIAHRVGRKNMPSYSYILFKLCELHEWHAVCDVCYLLKTASKLDLLDSIWERVCLYCGWKFISSPTFNPHHK